MTKTIVCLTAMALLLLSCHRPALAMGEGTEVTKATQSKLGLDFTLSADRVSDSAVLVRMVIPNQGKLANLKRVTLNVGKGSGSPEISADLKTTVGKDGALTVAFQLSPELAEKSSVELVLPELVVMGYKFYAVEVKGYIVDKQGASAR